MATCNDLFKKFNGEGYLKVPQSKIYKLNLSDENVRNVIKTYFEKNHPPVSLPNRRSDER